MTNTQQALHEAQQHQHAGRLPEARRAFLDVLKAPFQPPIVLGQIGLSLFRLGYPVDAEKAFKTAVSLFPDDSAAHHNLGSFYSMRQQHVRAELSYRRATVLDPDDPDTRCALGTCLSSQGHMAEAVAQFRLAVAARPDHPTYGKRLGTALFKLHCHEEAIEVLRGVLLYNPLDTGVRGILGCSLNMLGRSDEHVALVEEFLKSPQPLDESLSKFVLDLFVNPAITVADEGRMIAGLFGCLSGLRGAETEIVCRPADSRLTIGYLSSFLHKANYMAFLDTIVAAHDAQKFDIRVYSDADIGNRELAGAITADGVDILVDLNGFGSIDRMELLAMKPAPVVVSWFNAFSSLGLEAIDYLIGDDIVTPQEEDRHYKEAIWRLPGCYLIRHIDADAPPVSASPFARNGYCTFGSLAASHKIHTGCVELWARVLDAVPDSRLILRNADLDRHLARFLQGEFEKYRVDPARIELLGRAEHTDFLGTYDRIDVSLDSFPWNGGTTTVEALWQGVPVICFHGDKWASRAAATLVTAVGHPEWAGSDPAAYVRIAADLAGDPDRLQRTRRDLRQEVSASPLCDSAAFTRKLEEAFMGMARARRIIEWA